MLIVIHWNINGALMKSWNDGNPLFIWRDIAAVSLISLMEDWNDVSRANSVHWLRERENEIPKS